MLFEIRLPRIMKNHRVQYHLDNGLSKSPDPRKKSDYSRPFALCTLLDFFLSWTSILLQFGQGTNLLTCSHPPLWRLKTSTLSVWSRHEPAYPAISPYQISSRLDVVEVLYEHLSVGPRLLPQDRISRGLWWAGQSYVNPIRMWTIVRPDSHLTTGEELNLWERVSVWMRNRPTSEGFIYDALSKAFQPLICWNTLRRTRQLAECTVRPSHTLWICKQKFISSGIPVPQYVRDIVVPYLSN